MAIAIAQEKKGVNWFGWLIALTLIGGMALLAYKVLISPAAFWEAALGPGQEAISVISQISIDPSAVVNAPAFRVLRKQIPDIGVGEVGRTNPFLPF